MQRLKNEKRRNNNMKTIKIVLVTFYVASIAFVLPGASFAGEVDILVQKLVEKGVLTPGDAQQIITETKEEVRLQVAKGDSPSLPKWVQSFKLKGDLRYRYEYREKKGSSSATDYRDRSRIRFRLGAEANVNQKVKVAAGLATGSADSKSTNYTFENGFQTPDIRLDYAYAEYMPFTWMTIVAGKYKRKPYLWTTSDLLWDSDVNPDGAAIHASFKPYDNVEVFGNLLYGITPISSSNRQYPFMIAAQPGFKWNIIPKKMHIKAAGVYYDFEGLDNYGTAGDGTFSYSEGTNTTVSNTSLLRYEYDSWGGSAEIGIVDPLGDVKIPHLEIPYLAAYGDIISNPDPDDNDIGWLIGAKLGAKKVSKKGQWQAKLQYRRLETDAWVDWLSDSDFYSGATNAKGTELIFQYAPLDNCIFGVDWYHTRPITGSSTNRTEDLVQLDMVFKF
jgi:hypothetical protein